MMANFVRLEFEFFTKPSKLDRIPYGRRTLGACCEALNPIFNKRYTTVRAIKSKMEGIPERFSEISCDPI